MGSKTTVLDKQLADISFSIIMANYNSSEYVEQSIKSVINQTYENWELIIVDDCSTDNSREVIENYTVHNKIELFKTRKNLGYSGALKLGISKSRNKVIGILDSDDALHSKALDVMARSYKLYSNYGFIYSTMWRCNENLEARKVDKTIRKIDVNKSHWLINPPVSHFKTFKKEFYGKTKGFEIAQKKSVDRDIIYKLSEVTQFKFINKPLYYYREHQQGISQGSNEFGTKFYSYRAKLNAYKRRLNTNLPNFKYKNLRIIYYYNIVFYRVFKFFINIFLKLHIDLLIDKLLLLIPNKTLRNKLIIFKNRYIDIFG
ncbi:MAG: glycosyltransferase [Candidatus Lokiarchaeota archaeon]|nr:glycosyltransferase [Candidatus Lokiarchaeota archaeon]